MKLVLLLTLVTGVSWAAWGSFRPVNEGPFSYELPTKLSKIKTQGIDSLVGRYQSAGRKVYVSFDYGWYSSSFSEFDKYPGYSRVPTVIGGRPAERIAFQDWLSDGLRFSKCAGVYVPNLCVSSGQASKLNVLYCGQDEDDMADASRVFSSIRFDQCK